ncbi:MAG TPA: GNAT family N-acetyltransferase [Puia sp.]|nr:GNAT family N-acetyltransferase [Puia sp.]
MDKITIRKARPDDLDTLLQFEQGVIGAERPYDPTLRPDPLHYYDIPELISADHIELLVAELESGQLIGCGYARIEQSKHYLRHLRQSYLGFMYVLPEHRGKGVNQRIIAALKDWSVEKGITEMRLDVYTENASAIKAYEKAGFTPYMVDMRIGIGKEPHLGI